MATYCVTYSEDDDWGNVEDRFKYRPEADARLEEARIAGRFARLIRWESSQPTEIARVNSPTAPPSGNDERCPRLPEEVDAATALTEGAMCQITINAYERNPEARRRCIEHHGTSCCICGFNFGAVYGEVAEGYIHVHHLRPLSEVGGEYVVDPVDDLRPVCPNCHAVLHCRVPAFSIEEVRGFLRH